MNRQASVLKSVITSAVAGLILGVLFLALVPNNSRKLFEIGPNLIVIAPLILGIICTWVYWKVMVFKANEQKLNLITFFIVFCFVCVSFTIAWDFKTLLNVGF